MVDIGLVNRLQEIDALGLPHDVISGNGLKGKLTEFRGYAGGCAEVAFLGLFEISKRMERTSYETAVALAKAAHLPDQQDAFIDRKNPDGTVRIKMKVTEIHGIYDQELDMTHYFIMPSLQFAHKLWDSSHAKGKDYAKVASKLGQYL